jgi:predicted transcriptional regulator
MAIQLPTELEERVTALATATRRDPSAVLAELVADALDDDDEEALRLRIAQSRAQIARGEGIDHDEAMSRLDTRLAQLGPRPQ